MATTYSDGGEVQHVAKSLIKKHRDDLSHVSMIFVFQQRIDGETSQAVEIKAKGKPVYYTVRVVSGLNAWVAGHYDDKSGEPEAFFLCVITKAWWDQMTPEQRQAMTHQMLCRMAVNDDGIPQTVEFDVREFGIIAQTYGAWNDELEAFLEVTAQMHLPIDDDDKSTAGSRRRGSEAAATAH